MKKVFVAVMVAVSLCVMMTTTAFAGNHGGSKSSGRVCTVKTCNSTKTHSHNGKQYKAHSLNDGHKQHRVCGVKNCTKTTTHKHSGKTYFAHSNKDGHGYHGSKGGKHH